MSSDHGTELDTTERPSETRVATFIRKLYTMLEESLFPDIFDWTEDGEAIIIKKPTEFGHELLPRYFKHNRITSFIRQLNMYNFQKKRSRTAEHIYSHELFKKGQKQLLIQIKRKVKDGFITNQQNPGLHGSLSTADGSCGDISIIVNENQMLKNLQEQTASRIQLLEEKLKELTTENQSLHMQVQQQRGKQNSMMEAFIKMRQENNPNQPFMYSNGAGNEKNNSEDSSQMGHKLVISKSTLLNNNSNMETLPESRIPSLQGVDTTALYANRYSSQENNKNQNIYGMDVNKMNPMGLRQPLNPIINSAGSYETIYYPMATKEEAMENYRNTMLMDYNNINNMNLLGKRAGQGEVEAGDLKKFMKNPSFGYDERSTLNLGDLRKLRQGFFSSIGDKEYENTFDTEIDLLCFQ